jgi:hypothetical protein
MKIANVDDGVLIMKKPLKLKFYSDSSHGWVAVKLALLVELGILEKVSAYSYYRGLSAYLEEDCDMSLLVNALKEAGVDFVIESKSDCNWSPIRSYDSIVSSLAYKNAKGSV